MRARYQSQERSWATLQAEMADDIRREIRARRDVPPHRDGEPATIFERFGDGYRMRCSCGATGEVTEHEAARREARGHSNACEARRCFIAERREQRRAKRAARDEQSWAATKAWAKRERLCIGGVTHERVNGEPIYRWYCLCDREVGTSHGTRLAVHHAREAHVARFATNPDERNP